jgi:hypothetical protein
LNAGSFKGEIVNCTAYRRLKHKTQVFFAPRNDHICTRIEHVNIVSAVSYTIAKQLGLNTELTDAIAIGHDLGHAPFGLVRTRMLGDMGTGGTPPGYPIQLFLPFGSLLAKNKEMPFFLASYLLT